LPSSILPFKGALDTLLEGVFEFGTFNPQESADRDALLKFILQDFEAKGEEKPTEAKPKEEKTKEDQPKEEKAKEEEKSKEEQPKEEEKLKEEKSSAVEDLFNYLNSNS